MGRPAVVGRTTKGTVVGFGLWWGCSSHRAGGESSAGHPLVGRSGSGGDSPVGR